MPGQGHVGAICVCCSGCYWVAPYTVSSSHILGKKKEKKKRLAVKFTLFWAMSVGKLSMTRPFYSAGGSLPETCMSDKLRISQLHLLYCIPSLILWDCCLGISPFHLEALFLTLRWFGSICPHQASYCSGRTGVSKVLVKTVCVQFLSLLLYSLSARVVEKQLWFT